MTVQGKKWWGDPTSPNYSRDGMPPFGLSSIERNVGGIFSPNDQFIFETLFAPFKAAFGYEQDAMTDFRQRIKFVRPLMDKMFDFEKKLIERNSLDIYTFKASSDFAYLRSVMIDRLDTLSKLGTYPNMLRCLNI